MSRNRTVLAVLLSVLAISILYAYFAMPRQEKAPPRESSRQTATRAGVIGAEKTPADNDERIDFGYLEQDVQDFPGADRDIFNFVVRIKPQPKPVVQKPVEVKPPVAPVSVQPPPIDVVNRSLSQFTFVGFLEKAGEKTVFLSSSGEMFLVKSGERFGVNREFLVKEIEGDVIRIKHDAREDIIELKLIEQEKLNSAVSAPARLAPLPAAETQLRTRPVSPNRRSLRRGTVPIETSPELNQEGVPETEEIPGVEDIPETEQPPETEQMPETEQTPETNEVERPEGDFNGNNQ